MLTHTAATVPVTMTVPSTAQEVFTILLAVAAALLTAYAAAHWYRTSSPVYLATVAGGALATFNEPIVNTLGHLYHPERGQWTLFETFDRGIPVWAIFGYLLYFGGAGIVILVMSSRQLTLPQFWAGMGAVILINLLIELPLLAKDVYVYYGEQPFEIGGLPLPWLFVNGVGALLGGLLIARTAHLLQGVSALLYMFVPPAAYYLGMAIGLPYFSLINSDAAEGWKWVGGGTTILLGLLVFHAVGKLIWLDTRKSVSRPSVNTTHTRARRISMKD